MDIPEIIRKIRVHGLKGTFDVIFKIKFPLFCEKLISLFFSKIQVQNVIVMESTSDFDMNTGALYEYLIGNDYNNEYKIIWLVRNPVKDELPKNVECFPMYGFSLKREYYINTAAYIICDNHIVRKRRNDQMAIYLGHATRTIKNSKGLLPIPDNYDVIISASDANNEIMSQIYECNIDKMIVTGMPVDDVLFRKWNDFDRLNIKDTIKKTIIWMPTFRVSKNNLRGNDYSSTTETGLSLVRRFEEYNKLQIYLEQNNILLIIKFHPAQDINYIKVKSTNNILLLPHESLKVKGINLYKLLTQMDALISDFSSISFDYMLLNRPIAYDLSDINGYKLGLAGDDPYAYMPGLYLRELLDLYKFMDQILEGNDSYEFDRNRIKDQVHKFQDGKACERVVKVLNLERSN